MNEIIDTLTHNTKEVTRLFFELHWEMDNANTRMKWQCEQAIEGKRDVAAELSQHQDVLDSVWRTKEDEMEELKNEHKQSIQRLRLEFDEIDSSEMFGAFY